MAHGLVVGRFLPLHIGHRYLVEAARPQVAELSILVWSAPGEDADCPPALLLPIALREAWVRELFGGLASVGRVVADDSQLTQAVAQAIGRPVSAIFSADALRGQSLAEALGAKLVLLERVCTTSGCAISSTALRASPWADFPLLSRPVRQHLARRVCVFGPESTGKTTLAKALAARYRAPWVAEQARTFIEAQGDLGAEDMPRVAQAQAACEDAMARQAGANGLVFCDTDAATTRIWSHELFGTCDAEVERLARETSGRYVLTLLMDIDLVWVDDVARYRPEGRREFFEQCQQTLVDLGRRFVVVRGEGNDRLDVAAAAVDALLLEPGQSLVRV